MPTPPNDDPKAKIKKALDLRKQAGTIPPDSLLERSPYLSPTVNPEENFVVNDPGDGVYGLAVAGFSKTDYALKGAEADPGTYFANVRENSALLVAQDLTNQDRISYQRLPPANLSNVEREQLLKQSCQQIESGLGEIGQDGGSTLTASLVSSNETTATISTANLGDSYQMVLQRTAKGWELTHLNQHHDLSRAQTNGEQARLNREKLDHLQTSQFMVGNNLLEPSDEPGAKGVGMTKTLGDNGLYNQILKPGHTSHVPDVTHSTVDLGNGPAILITASDGIDDYVNRITEFATAIDPTGELAKQNPAEFNKQLTEKMILATYEGASKPKSEGGTKPDNTSFMCSPIAKNQTYFAMVADGHDKHGHLVAQEIAEKMPKMVLEAYIEASPKAQGEKAMAKEITQWTEANNELKTLSTTAEPILAEIQAIKAPLLEKIGSLTQKIAQDPASAENRRPKLEALKKVYSEILNQEHMFMNGSQGKDQAENTQKALGVFKSNVKFSIQENIIENDETKSHSNSFARFGVALVNAVIAVGRTVKNLVSPPPTTGYYPSSVRTDTREKAYDAMKSLDKLGSEVAPDSEGTRPRMTK